MNRCMLLKNPATLLYLMINEEFIETTQFGSKIILILCFNRVINVMNTINSVPQIHFAPLQGYTDNAYRYAFEQVIGDVDYFYTPYLSVENDQTIKLADDLAGVAEHSKAKTIPQILPANIQELKLLIKPIIKGGFQHININMGCPYPMATRKGRGAALVHQPDVASDMLNYLSDHTSCLISIKIRTGLTDHSTVFPFLEKIPASKTVNVIIHPRTASQLYRGEASADVFLQCKNEFPNLNLIYNGDVSSFSVYEEKFRQLPDQKSWMIGRGLLHHPFLAWQIKNSSSALPQGHQAVFETFIDELIRLILLDSKNKEHALNRCKLQLTMLFEADRCLLKYSKKMKKARSLDEVQALVKEMKLMS